MYLLLSWLPAHPDGLESHFKTVWKNLPASEKKVSGLVYGFSKILKYLQIWKTHEQTEKAAGRTVQDIIASST